ncbi:hypothetical protein SAMD00019534_030070 [Acytostelium subglobosum LB1]|uniref:hypothetical protein n=1 Tax=Acytostelium subglobosum LB1 TaxID=1410327 RepID=UPI000644A4B4|nr:hypothetical protein SAMD00019534_030070 [Acytostelium subglobosum LB1]GAM19832.1 hypothetical protein SAMD00019534_030070 [Acytostelium subglobosum LB1]|eukprot:XP_012756594.1 hypothetical protein SAMD00019534_030070 [Acytostelium subglobosum LB1]
MSSDNTISSTTTTTTAEAEAMDTTTKIQLLNGEINSTNDNSSSIIIANRYEQNQQQQNSNGELERLMPDFKVVDHNNGDGGDDDDDTSDDIYTPLNPKDLHRVYNEKMSKQHFKSFMRPIPLSMEEFFRRFDDPIIALCQKNTSRPVYYLSLIITSLVAIEIAIATPYILFILGQDALATEFTYLALLLALLSQVPKRFFWRFRPYMVHRAKTMKKDMTSSFPSRAVTCSVVYAYAIVWAVLYYQPGQVFRWWMPLLFIGMILATSFARINLGVHYPSDCLLGVLQGTIVCLVGTGLRSLDILGCWSCWDNGCYSTSPATTLEFSTLGRLNFIMLSCLIILCVLIPIVTVMKPVDFWSKCDRVYGMLFPSIFFQLLFLCPKAYSEHASLPKPPSPHWYSYLFAIGLAIGATIFAVKAKLRHPLITFWIIFTILTSSLFIWRIAMIS